MNHSQRFIDEGGTNSIDALKIQREVFFVIGDYVC